MQPTAKGKTMRGDCPPKVDMRTEAECPNGGAKEVCLTKGKQPELEPEPEFELGCRVEAMDARPSVTRNRDVDKGSD